MWKFPENVEFTDPLGSAPLVTLAATPQHLPPVITPDNPRPHDLISFECLLLSINCLDGLRALSVCAALFNYSMLQPSIKGTGRGRTDTTIYGLSEGPRGTMAALTVTAAVVRRHGTRSTL